MVSLPVTLANGVGLGEGPKQTLEMVDYGVESRSVIKNWAWSLGFGLELYQNRARPNHFKYYLSIFL